MDPYLGELRIVSFGFAPKGWALCNGQLLPINQNQALFSLLGTMYGGDGRTNFALPDLRGRIPRHRDPNTIQGTRGGEETHTLVLNEMPSHTHRASGNNTTNPDQGFPGNNVWAANSYQSYSPAGNSSMDASTIAPSTGGGQPHQNMSPYLTLNVIIALQGIFPSRN